MEGGATWRMSVGASVQRCRWLPCSPALVTSEEPASLVTFAAIGCWSEDAQQHAMAAGYIEQSTSGPAHFTVTDYMPASGSITDMQVSRLQDQVLVVAGTSTGQAAVLSMAWPATGGIVESQDVPAPSDVNSSWYTVTAPSPINAVDINPTSAVVVAASSAGSLQLLDLGSGSCSTLRPASPWSGFAAARWLDANTVATAGIPGGLCCWDVRKGPTPVTRTPATSGHTGYAAADASAGAARRLTCLASHTSRAWTVCTGSSGGGIALWDLRRAAGAPVVQKRPETDSVGEVAFDPQDAGPGGDGPAVLYCTAAGRLCRTSLGSCSSASGSLSSGEVLLQEPFALNSFDAGSGGSASSSILAAVDGEMLCVVPREQGQPLAMAGW